MCLQVNSCVIYIHYIHMHVVILLMSYYLILVSSFNSNLFGNEYLQKCSTALRTTKAILSKN